MACLSPMFTDPYTTVTIRDVQRQHELGEPMAADDDEVYRPLSDPDVRRRWRQACDDRARLEAEYRDPELGFLIDQADSRIRAAARDLREGRWTPGQDARAVLRGIWDVYRAPVPEDLLAQEHQRDPKWDGRYGLAHAAAVAEAILAALATEAGRAADHCHHLTVVRQVYVYAGQLYDGAGHENASSVTARLAPMEIIAVALWALTDPSTAQARALDQW